MDRYVVREPRVGADYPQGNQMIAFPTNAGGNNAIPLENVYYGAQYATEFSNMHRVNTGFMNMPQINVQSSFATTNLVQGPVQGQLVSGIDPRYLAGYSDNNAQYIVSGQRNPSFGNNYENRSFMGPIRDSTNTFQPHIASVELHRNQQVKQPRDCEGGNQNLISRIQQSCHEDNTKQGIYEANVKSLAQSKQGFSFQRNTNVIVPTTKITEIDTMKSEVQNQIITRSDKLKALHKSGPRAFSGPVEKVLKWHKALQDIGVLVLYEIVAKCVSVSPGKSCAKNLVVRDDNGPAMQVVYYEIDFLLPELKPPCTVRVIGRMMVGTSRLLAFNVRLATGDDVATLPRRAAVAAHHVAKLCKEFGA